MMDVETLSDDYWPFPSKEFTLLYLLLNSPRPLVKWFSKLVFIHITVHLVVHIRGRLT